jgi:uncharacterized protein YoxC
MVKFTFDHTQEDYLDACGVKETQLEVLFDKVNEVGQSCNSASEVVEKLASSFTKTELAFLINHMQSQLRQMEQSNPLDMLREIWDASSQRDEPGMPGMPLGEPGEA